MLTRYFTVLLSFVTTAISGCQPAAAPPAPVAQISRVSSAVAYPQGFWPRWSGPQGDLVSTETGWVAKWPDAGPGLNWRTHVGIGFSSVSVVEGRLFTMGHHDGQDTVYGLDAATGEQIWTYSYACQLVDNLHEGGPGSTPTVDGDRVYTLSRVGDLFCFDGQSGKVIWFKQLEEELGVEHPDWGFTCSPLVVDEKLIVDVGPTVALDKSTGKTIWQTERFLPGYGSPNLLKFRDTSLVTVLNNDALLLVGLNDGEIIALHAWESDFATSSTTPIVSGDTLFISTGYGTGCALLKFDGSELNLVYKNRHIRNHMNNCVLWKGYLYGVDGQSSNSGGCRLVCMDHTSGEVAWTQRGMGCGSLTISDGRLIVLSDQGVLATVEATPDEYREISRAQVLEGRCWTVPVLAGHRIYCRNAAGDLVCVNVGKVE